MRTWRCRCCRLPAVWPNRECVLCETGGSLFDAPRPGDYRQTDPRTSKHAAAANLTARVTQKKQILGRMLNGPVSSHEVADLCGGQNGPASKRLGELRDGGLIVECGTITSPGRRSTPRTLYRLTDDGRRDAELMVRGAA